MEGVWGLRRRGVFPVMADEPEMGRPTKRSRVSDDADDDGPPASPTPEDFGLIAGELDDLTEDAGAGAAEQSVVVVEMESLEALRRAIVNMRPGNDTEPLRLDIVNRMAQLPHSSGGDVLFGKGVELDGSTDLNAALTAPFTGISINGMCAQTRVTWWLIDADIAEGLAEGTSITVWIEPHTMAEKLKAYDTVEGGILRFKGDAVSLEMQSGANTVVVTFKTVDAGKDEAMIGLFDAIAPQFSARITAMDLDRKIKAMINDHDSPECTIRLHQLQTGPAITTALSFEARATTWNVVDGFTHKTIATDHPSFIDFRESGGGSKKPKTAKKKGKEKDQAGPAFDAEADADAAAAVEMAPTPKAKGVREFIQPANAYRRAVDEETIAPGNPMKIRQGNYTLLIDHLFDIKKLRAMFNDLSARLTNGLLLLFPVEDPDAPLVMVTNISGALGIHALMHKVPDE